MEADVANKINKTECFYAIMKTISYIKLLKYALNQAALP